MAVRSKDAGVQVNVLDFEELESEVKNKLFIFESNKEENNASIQASIPFHRSFHSFKSFASSDIGMNPFPAFNGYESKGMGLNKNENGKINHDQVNVGDLNNVIKTERLEIADSADSQLPRRPCIEYLNQNFILETFLNHDFRHHQKKKSAFTALNAVIDTLEKKNQKTVGLLDKEMDFQEKKRKRKQKERKKKMSFEDEITELNVVVSSQDNEKEKPGENKIRKVNAKSSSQKREKLSRSMDRTTKLSMEYEGEEQFHPAQFYLTEQQLDDLYNLSSDRQTGETVPLPADDNADTIDRSVQVPMISANIPAPEAVVEPSRMVITQDTVTQGRLAKYRFVSRTKISDDGRGNRQMESMSQLTETPRLRVAIPAVGEGGEVENAGNRRNGKGNENGEWVQPRGFRLIPGVLRGPTHVYTPLEEEAIMEELIRNRNMTEDGMTNFLENHYAFNSRTCKYDGGRTVKGLHRKADILQKEYYSRRRQ